MQFKDTLGQSLRETDQVLFGLGLGQMSVATVSRTETGLDPNHPQPLIKILVEFSVPAAPNGVVPGVIKIAESTPAIST